MKNLIIVKPGTLKSTDKQKLTKAGNIVIEHPDPHYGISQKVIDDCGDKYIYTNCYSCGDRIYMLSERLKAIQVSKTTFYCNRGHSQVYK